MKTRLIPILLILALLLGMVPAMAAEPELKGSLGESIAWELEPVEGVLTLTGEGAIPDFSYSDGAPWYPYRSRIFKAVLDEKITAVGAYAFNECSRLTELTAGTLSAVGEGAFSNCVLLGTAAFTPGEALTVGADAFYGCTSLKSIDLGADEGVIGAGAFTYCMALEEIVLPEKMARLEAETFSNCQNLRSLTVPEGLEYIGKSCFRACAALEEFSFPTATLRTVERYAFSGCEKLVVTFAGDAPAFAPAKDASASFSPGVTLRFPFNAEGWVWPLYKGYETEIVYPELPFKDLDAGAWYIPSVQHVYFSGLMNGVSETAFAPSNPMTRGQLVTVLYRIAGSPDVEAENPFKDVAESAYYYDAVRWAQDGGIVTGLSADTFGPDSRVTRQQMCAILYRYAAMCKLSLSQRDPLTDFSDLDKLADYAKDPMSWCVAMGFINGVKSGDTTVLDPQGNATRAQIAKVLTQFDRYLTGEELAAQDNWEQSIIIPETLPDIDREDPLYVYAREIFDVINAKRAASGLNAYVWNDRVFLAAQARAKELSSQNALGHNRPDGSYYDTVFAEYEIESTTRNEIVAMGFNSAESLVDTWADKPATSSVISAVVYSQAAVGVAQLPPTEEGGEGRYFYALLVIG